MVWPHGRSGLARDPYLRLVSVSVSIKRKSRSWPMGVAMSLSELVIDSITWDEVEVLSGSGHDLAGSLRRFVRAGSPDELSGLWFELEGVAFAQETIYGSALLVLDVMLAVVADRSPEWLRMWAVEVIRFILNGDSEAPSSLRQKCIAQARAGTWLLAAQACGTGNMSYREALLEVLEQIDPEVSRIVTAASS